MAHLSGIIYKNMFCVGEYSTNNTLNGVKALWTVPSSARSPFLPYYGFVRTVAGTSIESQVTITIGTAASAYNQICTISNPTTIGTLKFDAASNVLVTPGTTISYKYTGSTNGNTTHFYEIYLVGTFLTAN